jgi:hypothetical protein
LQLMRVFGILSTVLLVLFLLRQPHVIAMPASIANLSQFQMFEKRYANILPANIFKRIAHNIRR